MSNDRPAEDSAKELFASFLERLELDPVLNFEDWLEGSSAQYRTELRALHEAYRRLHPKLPGVPSEHSGSQAFFRRRDRPHPQPAPGLSPGKVVGDFRLLSLIGEGGMGQVWAAKQTSLGRRVAVKFVRPERVTEHALELFAREARAGGRLNHPNIVTVHGHGHSDGRPWIAMEYVEGAWTLKDFLDEASRAEELPKGYDRHVARFVAEIADAMQAAHDAGVIHRDLKPQNVLITSDDRPMVTDFGVARIKDETALSQTGDFAGTYLYMSPEQVLARRIGIDHRTDVFSLGVVLYELLALRRPFQGDTEHQVAEQIVYGDPPDPRTFRSKVPADLAVIAGKALEKDRDKRFQTMKELSADLRRHLANEPILARPPTRVERLVKWTKRNPAKSVAAGIASVTFTVIALLLAANVRTNRALKQERTKLASANMALAAMSIESEQRRAKAEENEHRAVAGEQQARDLADDVLGLSALQRLDDLVAEADRLWPAHPERIERYESWLERAQTLVDELPVHEAKLAELRARAVPWTEEEQARQRAEHPKHAELESVSAELEYRKRLASVLESGDPGPLPTAAEVGIDFSLLPATPQELSALAWPMVAPDRRRYGEERKGLLLASHAADQGDGLAPEERAELRRTLAWALVANGFFVEAAETMERALEEAGGARERLAGEQQRLLEEIEADLDGAQDESRARRIADLEGRLEALEAEVSERPDWLFADAQDKWWHTQLEKLVNGLRSFADEKAGLFSAGVSPEHGWGVKRRLASAVSLRDGLAPDSEHARAWAAALPAIRAAYPGLALTPQVGLVPIGPDPESLLWEFAHVETGAPAVRGADGRLVLTEETGLVFVLLPGGTFRMGAQKDDPSGPNYDPQARSAEGPVHEVTLSAFFLSKYEMTQGQWTRFVGTNPSRYKPGDSAASLVNPVEQVSWADCLGVMDRLGLSLPSEAQWEYGARGGTTTAWWTGSERESLLGVANLADQAAAKAGATWQDIKDWPELDDGHVVHAPVDTFRPNAFGLHNGHGNVWEWCLDGYDSSFYRLPAPKDPVSPPVGSSSRVYRGGSFGFAAVFARSAYRYGFTPSFADLDLGLRPARTIAP